MIRASLSVLVFAYLLIFLFAVFAVWIATGLARKRRENRALRHRLRCMMCACEFEDRTNTLLPRCPRCGTLNERFKFRSL
jgi:hypothetical protein